MTITVQLKRNDDTRSLALERTPSYSEILGISKQLFGIKDSEVSLKVRDDTKNDLVQISDAELAAVNDGLLQIIISDLRKSGGLRASAGLRRSQSLPYNCTATTGYAPSASSTTSTSTSPCTSTCTSPSPSTSSTSTSTSTSTFTSNNTQSCTNDIPLISEPPTPTSLVDRFYELVKYLNVPDVLHGLENFGYVTADQSVEIFALLEQLMVLFPELTKVLKYEDHEKPIHTVRHFGVTCDSCFETDICGARYKCAICPDFDMCEKCERKGILTHDITHPRIKMLVPSNCTFEHSCKSFNSQGEKHEDANCPFVDFVPPPVSPSRTYEKRRAQFNALYQRKQLREAMFELEMRRRKQYLKHREEMEQRQKEKARELLAYSQSCKEGEKSDSEKEQKNNSSSSSGNKKGILWGYFDNLKKQNKYQSITPVPLTSSGPVAPTPSSPSSAPPSAFILSASTPTSLASSLCSSGPLSTSPLANSVQSNASVTSPTITPASSSSSLTTAPPTFPSVPSSISSSDSTTITNPRSTRSSSLSQSTGVCSTSASWTTETDFDEPKAVDPYLAMSRMRKEKHEDKIEEDTLEDEKEEDEKKEEKKEEKQEAKISATEDYHPRPPLVPTISSRLKVMKKETLAIPDSPDSSPVLPHLALGSSPTSPAPPISKLRQCSIVEAEEEEFEDDDFDDEDESSESGSGSDKNEPTSLEADSLHVLTDMGFDEKNGDLLSTIRKKKGDLFSTIRELLN